VLRHEINMGAVVQEQRRRVDVWPSRQVMINGASPLSFSRSI